MEDLQGIIIKKTVFQIVVKAVNNIGGLDSLVPTILVFRVYLRMHSIDPLAPTIIQKTAPIEKAIKQVGKI